MTTDKVALLPLNVESRERMPGSPLVPGGITWSDDSRVAVVSEMSILIATFRSHELEMFQPKGPAVSKDFVFLPEKTVDEHIPVPIQPVMESLDSGLPRASTTYFLLNESDRHQHNPKELSLSKNAGRAFVAAEWGPRGSAPNSACALLALTAASRITLHFPPSFHMDWKEVAVFSETLFAFFETTDFQLGSLYGSRRDQPLRSVNVEELRKEKERKKKNNKRKSDPVEGQFEMNCVNEYTNKCAMMSTLTIAWSPFMITLDKQDTISLIALSGRKVSTIWAYAYPSFVAGQLMQPYLSSSPIAWIDTKKYGWVSTSTWQQMHRHGTTYATRQDLGLALGTSGGNVLIATVPVRASSSDGLPQELAVDRIIVAPHHQPVFGLCMGSRWTYSNSPTNDLVVASGSTISVWNLKKKKQAQPNAMWKAHDGNLTGIDINYFGDTIFSAAVDGAIKVWEKSTGKLLYSSDATTIDSVKESNAAASKKYPVFGLAMSPSSAQLACVFVIPPASRPNRKSQADVSYSRVSISLEYIPSPWVKSSDHFVDVVCRILSECESVGGFMDVVWLCYNDNASLMSLNGVADLAIPSMLSKIGKAYGEESSNDVLARQPIYLYLCEELEKRYYKSVQDVDSTKNDPKTPIPLFLQASLLLRSAITPADHQVAAQNAVLAKIRRALGVYWAERCLRALVGASTKANMAICDYIATSLSEKRSALAMADFLSVQDSLTHHSESLVTHMYSQLDSTENVRSWIAFVNAKAKNTNDHDAEVSENTTAVYTPPSRELCFICEKDVPFGELEIVCESGHTLERCFFSFRCIAAMEVWKCMGCGASASEIDFSSSTLPFYLLNFGHDDDVGHTTLATSNIICRLCGSYCSFQKY